MAIIVATAILHNIAIEEREDEPPNEVEVEDDNPIVLPYGQQAVIHENNRIRTSDYK